MTTFMHLSENPPNVKKYTRFHVYFGFQFDFQYGFHCGYHGFHMKPAGLETKDRLPGMV